MKKLITLLALLSCTVLANAATSITSATVSGEWTLAGSPYLIAANTSVPPDSVLIIDPGVEVIFQGYYSIVVYGHILAIGSSDKLITFHINDTTGYSNSVDSTGGWGGIAIQPPSDTASVFTYCNFSDAKYCSPVYASQASLYLTYCNFFHNNGGIMTAVVDSTNYFEMSHCNVYNNFGAVNVQGWDFLFAAGTYPASSNCSVHNCNFYNNAATGIIQVVGVNLVFRNNNVYNNTAIDSSGMTSIFCASSSHALIMEDSVYQNTSNYQGAISCQGANVDINRCFVANNATMAGPTGSADCHLIQGGGGIRLQSCPHPIIRNSIIVNNYAALAGGAVYVIYSSATIINNQILNNTGDNGGALYVQDYWGDTVNVVVKNNIFFNNVTITGFWGVPDTDNIYAFIDSTAILEFDHNWSGTPFALDPVSDVSIIAFYNLGDTSANIVGTNPGLVAPTLSVGPTDTALTANFALQSTSPCIHGGDTTGFFATIGYADYTGNYRIYGGALDIGAYQYGAGPIPASVGVKNAPVVAKQMDVYPNPAMNMLFVATPEANGSVTITDMAGRTILNKQVITPLTYFDVQSIPRGLYIATWNNGSGALQTQKLAVQ